MDLGTTNTIVIYNDQVIINEPSIVALDKTTNKIVAVGKHAQQLNCSNIETIHPLRYGLIADVEMAEFFITGLFKMANIYRSFLPPALRMVISIPSSIVNFEQRAVQQSAEMSGAKKIRMIHGPMAAAIGIGINVLESHGNMIVDIGGGITEIAVISRGGIVCNKSIMVAGNKFNDDVVEFMSKKHNIMIDRREAEIMKISVGSAIPKLENPPNDYETSGCDLLTGIQKNISANYIEIYHALDKSISCIESAILETLANTPSDLASDIYKNGIYLVGGGSLLRGLDQRIASKTGLKVHIANDPLLAVAYGTGIALKNFNKFGFLVECF